LSQCMSWSWNLRREIVSGDQERPSARPPDLSRSGEEIGSTAAFWQMLLRTPTPATPRPPRQQLRDPTLETELFSMGRSWCDSFRLASWITIAHHRGR
jgi:hypothetical protein